MPDARALLEEHERVFDRCVERGDFAPLCELFTPDAELEFVGVPFGPFRGREEIAAAYASHPPDDGLDVVSVVDEGAGVLVERFAWHRGGGGTMRVTVRDGAIARLVVAFDAAG